MINAAQRKASWVARPYQTDAAAQVRKVWADGAKSVLVVAPPGGGKTEIGLLAIQTLPVAARVLWVAHTRDLVSQARDRISVALGEHVSTLMAGSLAVAGARVTVAIVHSLLELEQIGEFDLVILDEAHHYVATEWRGLLDRFSGKPPLLLGLTATPERQDGEPLGDVFEQLVVAANYSDLIAGGWIVPTKVIRPKRWLRGDYAQHPVDAWAQYGGGGQTFGFYPSIAVAEHYDREFALRGVDTALLHSEIDASDRAEAFERFERGELRMLSTVASAIEGLNVPACSVAILGRSFQSVGSYLQATGRPNRASAGKSFGVAIDLTGCSVRHGPPDSDRVYALTGKAISGDSGDARPPAGGEREDPEVIGLEMLSPSDWSVPAQTLMDPSPERLRRDVAVRRAIRQVRTKFGSKAALVMQKQVEAMYR